MLPASKGQPVADMLFEGWKFIILPAPPPNELIELSGWYNVRDADIRFPVRQLLAKRSHATCRWSQPRCIICRTCLYLPCRRGAARQKTPVAEKPGENENKPAPHKPGNPLSLGEAGTCNVTF